MNALMDQVQNLTSLVAHEKLSNESNNEESTLQQARLQQLADRLEKETEKCSELDDAVTTLQAQKKSIMQGNTERLALLESISFLKYFYLCHSHFPSHSLLHCFVHLPY